MDVAGIRIERRIGLGTNRLTHTRENVAVIKAAVAAGVQMIDTAHTYTGGQSEETIGDARSPIPGNCIVATKGGLGSGRPQALRDEIEISLTRLRTDSISLYYLHRVDPAIPLEESIAAIKEHQDRRKIRRIGSDGHRARAHSWGRCQPAAIRLYSGDRARQASKRRVIHSHRPFL